MKSMPYIFSYVLRVSPGFYRLLILNYDENQIIDLFNAPTKSKTLSEKMLHTKIETEQVRNKTKINPTVKPIVYSLGSYFKI